MIIEFHGKLNKVIFAFPILFMLQSFLYADSSSYYEGDGGVVFPMKSKNIVMKKDFGYFHSYSLRYQIRAVGEKIPTVLRIKIK